MRKLIPWKSQNPEPSSEEILARIERADDLEINDIIQAVIRRYKAVFPDWEVIFLSLPLHGPEREQMLEQTIEQLKKL